MRKKIIRLFDRDADGRWSRQDFGEFLKFLYLCLLLESEARGCQPVPVRDLFQDLVATGEQFHISRLYPNCLRRQEVEKQRFLSLWLADLGPVAVKVAITLQKVYRMKKEARRKIREELENKAATRIQKCWRGKKGRQRWKAKKDAQIEKQRQEARAKAVTKIQALGRGVLLRLQYVIELELIKAGEEVPENPGRARLNISIDSQESKQEQAKKREDTNVPNDATEEQREEQGDDADKTANNADESHPTEDQQESLQATKTEPDASEELAEKQGE